MPAEHIANLLSIMRRGHERQKAVTIETRFAPRTDQPGWILGTYAPMGAQPGQAPRTSFVVIDITARKEAELEASRQSERLQIAIEATGLGLWEYDIVADGLAWDARTREIYGIGPDGPVTFASYSAALHPDDAEAQQAIYEAALRGENAGRYIREHRIIIPDGRSRWIEGAGRVVFDQGGQPLRVLGTVRDVTERVRARERQGVLLAELNHRVKNNLAMVQALASHTLRSTPDPAAFREAFEARLQALAGAHDLLTQKAWVTAEFAEVIARALQPFPASALDIEGPAAGVEVRPDLAVNLTLLVHELGTNAVKHGALSRHGGRIRIAWQATPGGVTLHWRETGGPPVTPPSRSGLGLRLIRRSITGAGGTAEVDYRPDGVVAVFAVPLAAGVVLEG
jgi:PAS domain S-box-containing protein